MRIAAIRTRQIGGAARRARMCGVLCVVLAAALAACGTSEPGPPEPEPAQALAEVPTRRLAAGTAADGSPATNPYRWLEDTDAPAVRRWLRQHDARTRAWLDERPGRDRLEGLARRLWSRERRSVPMRRGELLFYSFMDGRRDRAVWQVAETPSVPGRVFLDPGAPPLDAGPDVTDVWPDPAGRRVVYALGAPGSESRTLHIRTVDTGGDLPESLVGAAAVPVAWSGNGAGFYYGRWTATREEDADRAAQIAIWHHRLGSDQTADALVHRPATPARDARPFVSRDGRFLVARTTGPEGDAIRLLDLWSGGARWVHIAEPDGSVNEPVAFRQGSLLLRTTLAAPRGRLVAVDPGAPAPDSWVDVLPEGPDVLTDAALVGERLLAIRTDGDGSRIDLYDAGGGRLRRVEIPERGVVTGLDDGGERETYFRVLPPGRPGSVYRLDISTGAIHAVWASGEGSTDHAAETTRFPSDDGVWISMTLVAAPGLRRTGDNPVVLTPRWRPAGPQDDNRTDWLAWLQAGGVLALVDVRGADSPAERLQGRDATDAAVADLVSAAEWLLATGVTAARRLAVAGDGHGGLLTAAALARRPDLFAAALVESGTLPEDDFQRGCYPATLVIAGGGGAPPWHGYELAAALQHAQACDPPILLRPTLDPVQGLDERVRGSVDRLTFLLAALGVDEAAGPTPEAMP